MSTGRVVLSPTERRELSRRAGSEHVSAADARRARLLLLLADGRTYDQIRRALGCSSAYISRWKKRFLAERLAGLYRRYRGRRPSALTPELEQQILGSSRTPPPDGSVRWSTRTLARYLGINHMLVHRVWKRAGFEPGAPQRLSVAREPSLRGEELDILGLYLNPHAHAAVFGADASRKAGPRDGELLQFSASKQARRRRRTALPSGATSLLTAMEGRSAGLRSKAAASASSAEIAAFVADVVAHQSPEHEIHLVLEHQSRSTTKRIAELLEAHRRVQIHAVPTHSSWLAKIALWLANLGANSHAEEGVHDAVAHLRDRLLHFLGELNDQPMTFLWTSSPSTESSTFDSTVTHAFDSLVTTSNSIVTVGHCPTCAVGIYDTG